MTGTSDGRPCLAVSSTSSARAVAAAAAAEQLHTVSAAATISPSAYSTVLHPDLFTGYCTTYCSPQDAYFIREFNAIIDSKLRPRCCTTYDVDLLISIVEQNLVGIDEVVSTVKLLPLRNSMMHRRARYVKTSRHPIHETGST